jgi:hypothetical protein
MSGQASVIKVFDSAGDAISLHPSSLCGSLLRPLIESEGEAFLVYHKKVQTGQTFLFDCTWVPLAGVVLFGGKSTVARPSSSKTFLTVGGWINVKADELQAVLLRRLQMSLEDLLLAKVRDPTADIRHKQAIFVRVLETILEDSS